ncbi:hypothetical protein DPEC_G00008340 [Dallia pectoralis]|uniref:Uncharacterized protein n=1 Tax=Dallia pectoralis TaxID=75939 RepID=A0ACC2HKJ8_DALPE|nr:hypothetical protein DPEC_G00008340 [Dallia pectoralis]
MLRGTVLCAVLAGLCVIVTLCPVSCQLSQEDAETIVELHNTYRGQVVPSAAYMTKMKWDENLKIQAESYAVKCVWDYDQDLNLDEKAMGQNIYNSKDPFNATKAMEQWFLQNISYNFNHKPSCQDEILCRHYIQMVWANSLSVGCALHRCDTMERLSDKPTDFLVCNYRPAGYFGDKKPYERGEWCSRCPENLPRCDENLCVPESSEDVDEQTTDREQPQSNVGRVSTSLILSTSLVTLLLLEF